MLERRDLRHFHEFIMSFEQVEGSSVVFLIETVFIVW